MQVSLITAMTAKLSSTLQTMQWAREASSAAHLGNAELRLGFSKTRPSSAAALLLASQLKLLLDARPRERRTQCARSACCDTRTSAVVCKNKLLTNWASSLLQTGKNYNARPVRRMQKFARNHQRVGCACQYVGRTYLLAALLSVVAIGSSTCKPFG